MRIRFPATESIILLYLLLSPTTLARLTIDGHLEFSSRFDKIRGPKFDERDLTIRHSFKNVPLLNNDTSSSSEESESDDITEESTKSTARTTRNQKGGPTTSKLQYTTVLTTEYERGTTRKQKKNERREDQNHLHKKQYRSTTRVIHKIKGTTPTTKVEDKNVLRNDNFKIAIYLNDARPVLYNKTRYSIFDQKLNLQDIDLLWKQQKEVKSFDEYFKQPWRTGSKPKHTNKREQMSFLRKTEAQPHDRDINMFLNTALNDKGDIIQQIIIYNDTHYSYYPRTPPPSATVDENKWDITKWISDRIKMNLGNIFALGAKVPQIWQPKINKKNKAIGVNDVIIDPFGQVEEWYKQIKNKTENELGKPIQQIKNKTQAEVEQKISDFLIMQQALQQQLKNKTKEELSNQLNQQQEQLKNKTAGVLNSVIEETFSQWRPWAHSIGEDVTINSFIRHIKNNYLRIFDIVNDRITEYRWKKKLKHIARSYEDKFDEFITDTKQHKIRTNMGIQRVILNSIIVSNRIVNRLVNFMMGDMDKRGFLHHSSTPSILRDEFKQQFIRELKRACTKLGVCGTRNGFSDFIASVLIIILSVDDSKFNEVFDSLIDAVNNIDFSRALGVEVNKNLKKRIRYIHNLSTVYKRAVVMIIKNIIANKNAPLIMYDDNNPNFSRINTTMAFLEILNTIDEKVHDNNNNVETWNDIRRSMSAWADNKRSSRMNTRSGKVDIKTAIESILVSVLKTNEIDGHSWINISRNAKQLFL